MNNVIARNGELVGVRDLVERCWIMRPTPGEGLCMSPFDLVMPLLICAAWLWFVLGTHAARTALETINRELAAHA